MIKSILLFGPPGSGKGTQAELLCNYFNNIYHLSTGELFRKLDKNSELSKKCQSYFNLGQLVPDEIVIDIFNLEVIELIKSKKFNVKTDILLLDGIPRTANQLKLLNNINIIKVIFLNCNDNEILVKRIIERGKTSNRVDDLDENKIKTRISVYLKDTLLTINNIDKNKILEIDCNKDKVLINKKIIKEIGEIYENN